MQRGMVSVVCLALAACGTPQQQCIGTVTQDLRVVDQLITETQGNLARGYAFVTVTQSVPQYVDCTPEPTKKVPKPRHQSCLVDVAQSVSSPAAIDLEAEAVKLASLQRKRAALAAASGPAILACQQHYPEAAR